MGGPADNKPSLMGAIMNFITPEQSKGAVQPQLPRFVAPPEEQANPAASFLKDIAVIESSSGKNVEHKKIESGPQKGVTAYGRYGLLPPTIREMAGRAVDAKSATPEIKELRGLSDAEITKRLTANPALEQKMAEILANHVLKKQNGDEARAAYSWLNGHNRSPNKISDSALKRSGYVQKFNELKKQRPVAAPIKPLTAVDPTTPVAGGSFATVDPGTTTPILGGAATDPGITTPILGAGRKGNYA